MNEWLQGNIEMTCLMLYQANFGAECEQHTKKGWEEMGGKEDACVVGEEGEIKNKKKCMQVVYCQIIKWDRAKNTSRPKDIRQSTDASSQHDYLPSVQRCSKQGEYKG